MDISYVIRFCLVIRIVGSGDQLGPLGTSATSWPLYLHGVIMRMENLVE
jgi:hypothetical protein